MIREGSVQQIEVIEKCLLSLGKAYVECMHDGKTDTEKLFVDQTDNSKDRKVFYRLYEVYTTPVNNNFLTMTVTPSSMIRLWFDYRSNTGLIEANDRDWARLWGFTDLRIAVNQIDTNRIERQLYVQAQEDAARKNMKLGEWLNDAVRLKLATNKS